MKRVILGVPALFLAAGLCMAQNWQARHQIGTATQELRAEGLSAAHSRIPLGSKAKVTNPANGLEIEVTITAQIPESPHRIIDLSPSAARALDMKSSGPVMVASLSQQSSTGQLSEVDVQMGKQPFYITVNNYIVNPGKPGSPENPALKDRVQTDYSALAPDMAAALPAALPDELSAESPEDQPSLADMTVFPPEQPAALPTAVPVKEPLFNAPPVHDPQIIPGLPNPHTDKVYRLMVGTYPGVDSAFRICQQLQTAGFDVVQEQAGDMCRVFAAGIPASRVYYAAKRLGAIGFSQVWIQE